MHVEILNDCCSAKRHNSWLTNDEDRDSIFRGGADVLGADVRDGSRRLSVSIGDTASDIMHSASVAYYRATLIDGLSRLVSVTRLCCDRSAAAPSPPNKRRSSSFINQLLCR